MKTSLTIIRSLGILAAIAILGIFTYLHIVAPMAWSTIASQVPLYLACLLLFIPFSRLTPANLWFIALGLLSVCFAYWIASMLVHHSSPGELAIILALGCSQIFVIAADRRTRV